MVEAAADSPTWKFTQLVYSSVCWKHAAIAASRYNGGWADIGVDASEIREMSRISQKVSTTRQLLGDWKLSKYMNI